MKVLIGFMFAFSFGVWVAYHFNLQTPVNKFDKIVRLVWNELKQYIDSNFYCIILERIQKIGQYIWPPFDFRPC